MGNRIVHFILILCLAGGFLSVSAQGAEASGKVRLNKSSVTMRTGDSIRLSLRNAPKKGTVTWSSSAKGVAAVSKKGVVTAKCEGSADIRAKLFYKSGGKKRLQQFTCKITVKKKNAAAKNALVVYFSAPVDKRQGQLDGISSASRTAETGSYKGNTQYIAELAGRETGADIFRITAKDAYPDTYEAMVRRAEQEQTDNARPAIKNRISNISSYDTVYVGYPIWWSDMPQIMYTFFDTYDLSGKKIIPFCTHAGSELSGTVRRIKKLEPDADVYDGLAIYRTDVTGSDSRVKAWIQAKKK